MQDAFEVSHFEANRISFAFDDVRLDSPAEEHRVLKAALEFLDSGPCFRGREGEKRVQRGEQDMDSVDDDFAEQFAARAFGVDVHRVEITADPREASLVFEVEALHCLSIHAISPPTRIARDAQRPLGRIAFKPF